MPSARGLALRALVALDRGRSERLKSELDGKGLEGRDLAFAYELSHGVVRRERLLDFVLSGFAHRGLPKDAQLRNVLRLGLHQLLFVAGMPTHAAVHETVKLAKSNKPFVNAILRNVTKVIEDRAADPAAATRELAITAGRTLVLSKPLPEDEVERLSIVHSLPDWLAQRVVEQHGADGLRAVAQAASETPGINLRCGATVDRDALARQLNALGVETTAGHHARSLLWTGGESPFGTEPFRQGLFVVQDATAMAAVEALPCEVGNTVVDLCAAPGTKTTWLAEAVGAEGRVFAFDPDDRRRARIADNARRLQLEGIVTIVDDVAELPTGVDSALADVPCSNTGVLGRRVEARRRLQPATFEDIVPLQRELLARAISLVRSGGHVVYATCSIDRDENDDVVRAVLADDDVPQCELLRAKTTLPAPGSHDGGYFAVLRRGGVS